jgi:hypothetical protein
MLATLKGKNDVIQLDFYFEKVLIYIVAYLTIGKSQLS